MQLTKGARNVTWMSEPRPGFTMIEIMMVLTIISIMAVISLPRINFTQFDMDAGARAVRMRLQNAQRLALTRQLNVVVGFDLANGKVRVLEDKNNNGVADADERVTWLTLEEGAAFGAPPSGINGTAGSALIGTNIKTLGGLPSVIFMRDGASSTDLEIYLTSQRRSANDYRGVTVLQSTGRADWFKFIDGAWKPGNL